MTEDLTAALKLLARTERRAHAIDAEWEARPSEVAFRQRAKAAPSGALANALGAALRDVGADDARYLCWVALDAVPDADLPHVATELAAMTDPDARVVASLALVGRARAVPAWLQEALRATLSDAAPRASRTQQAVIGILQRAAATPAHFELSEALRHGGRLFNAGKFYEAHEAWEDVWRPMKGAERNFFRGLIQLAVAMKKAREGNPAGVIRLLDRASDLLAPYEPAHRGVEITALRRTMTVLRDEAVAWREGRAERLTTEPPRLPS